MALSGCFYENPTPITSEATVCVYVSGRQGLMRLEVGKDVEIVQKIEVQSGDLTLQRDVLLAPWEKEVTAYSTELKVLWKEPIGFDVKKAFTINGTMVAVGENSIYFKGDVTEVPTVKDAAVGPDGVYLATEEGIYKFDGDLHRVSDASAVAICVDPAGDVYYSDGKRIRGELTLDIADVSIMRCDDSSLYISNGVDIYRVDLTSGDVEATCTGIYPADFELRNGDVYFVSIFTSTVGKLDMESCSISPSTSVMNFQYIEVEGE